MRRRPSDPRAAKSSGLANYTTVSSDPAFVPALTHTILFTVASLAFQSRRGPAIE